MKRLKFAEPLPCLILQGKKDITWRINDDKSIVQGDKLSLCSIEGKEFAKAKVIWTKDTTFRCLTDKDKQQHEQFASEEEMYQIYSGYYKIKVNSKTRVKVIKFKLL